MNASVVELRPADEGGYRGWTILGHNPLYPASAVCMMIGCFVLSRSMDLHAGGVWKLAGLLGVLNAYELLLIVTGLWLIRTMKLRLDGRLLLFAELFFIVDATHLNAELFAADVRIGGVINALVLLLAILKLTWIAQALQMKMTRGRYAVMAVMMAGLMLLPGALAMTSHVMEITPRGMFGVWGAIGGMIGLLGVVPVSLGLEKERPLNRLLKRLFVIAAILSLVAHGAMQTWVYRAEFDPAYAGPVLVGVSLVFGRERWGTRSALLAWVLPMAGIAAAMFAAHELIGGRTPFVFTPLRITLMAAAGAYVIHACRHRAWKGLITAGLCAAAAAQGVTTAQIIENAFRCIGWVIANLLPRTAFQWGVVCIMAAFALLGGGAMLSRRGKRVT
ncbi:MAG: hypothetical protein GC162_20950 [Planctomycetes bacterium]|nr:hypothetical protein [Planctomycetota bacterium]